MSNRKNKKKSSDLLPENCQLEICGASGFGDLMAAAIDPTDNPHGYKIYVLENKNKAGSCRRRSIYCQTVPQKRYLVGQASGPHHDRRSGSGTDIRRYRGKNGLFYLRSAERNSRMDYLLDKLGSSRVGDFVKVALIGEKSLNRLKSSKITAVLTLPNRPGCSFLKNIKSMTVFPMRLLRKLPAVRNIIFRAGRI